MCVQEAGDSTSAKIENGPPAWDDIHLPADHILHHLTDAHCHPTDLNLTDDIYDSAKLGAISAMATMVEDHEKVKALGELRPWQAGTICPALKASGPSVIACFGYHPWFTHGYSLLSTLPSKEDHYTSLFFTPKSDRNSKNQILLRSLLPYLPDPTPFAPLIDQLRIYISDSLAKGSLTMLGEIGLDAQARMRWPTQPAARELYIEYLGEKAKMRDVNEVDELGEWKRLTPFKTNMAHQRRIVEMQMEVAVELGVNVSFHCVASPGPTLDILTSFRDKYQSRFTNRINIDLHSAGGWTPEFWRSAQKQLLNLYASPSVLITGRVTHAAELIRAIPDDRMLVESDSHDIRMMARWVWGATEWVASVKGWKVEGRDGRGEGWHMEEDEDEEIGENGEQVDGEKWTVRILERNWARFMHLVD